MSRNDIFKKRYFHEILKNVYFHEILKKCIFESPQYPFCIICILQTSLGFTHIPPCKRCGALFKSPHNRAVITEFHSYLQYIPLLFTKAPDKHHLQKTEANKSVAHTSPDQTVCSGKIKGSIITSCGIYKVHALLAIKDCCRFKVSTSTSENITTE